MKLLATLMLPILIISGCDTFDSASDLIDKPRELIDKASPTEASRARRAGFTPGKKVYFVTEINNQRRSSGYRMSKETEFNSRPGRLLESSQKFEIVSREGQRLQQVITRKVISDPATSEAIYSSEKVNRNGVITKKSVTVTNGVAIFNEDNVESEVPVPANVLFSLDPHWIILQNPDIGDSFTAKVLDQNAKKVVTETATIRNISMENVLGVEMDIYEAEIQREGSRPYRIAFTSTGDLVRMQADNMISYATDKESAMKDQAKLQVMTSIPVSFQLPAWDNFNSILLRPVPAKSWSEFLTNSKYMTIEGAEIKLTKFKTKVRVTAYPMVGVEEMSEYLKPVEGIMANEGDIRDLAENIIKDETNALQIVAVLAGWIYQNIEFNVARGHNLNALDTLAKRSGDQVAHADLFASLARSIGIPTRHCSGALLQRGKAVQHVWCEAWINGTWVPVDTSVNRVGLPAGYILTAHGIGNGQPRDQFAWALREGGLGLEFISATKVHKVPTGSTQSKKTAFTLYPNKKKTYIAIAGNWLANIYWGFSVNKPESWDGKIGLNSVSVIGPDKQAMIKIEALNKVLPCTESQLDMVVSSLERSLPGFNVINKGRVYFGKRQDNSLFIDFTVTQEGSKRRCQMYIIPKRGRSYRVTAWAPSNKFDDWLLKFKEILDTVAL